MKMQILMFFAWLAQIILLEIGTTWEQACDLPTVVIPSIDRKKTSFGG